MMCCLLAGYACAANPKREFRGAWMHTVYQDRYARMTTEENKVYLREQLDRLKATGCNAVIFQVRPSADAFYESELEPWSRFLTGTAGKAPEPFWDPLQFMAEEAHARGMELHAWLNPYRVTTSKSERLPKGHLYHQHPERFVRYGGRIYFDPGVPENRAFIEQIIKDIISRYDVDAIHFDDYFYPYPVKGADFPDGASYKKYGGKMKRGDWRRHNVDLLIEEIHRVIAETKPWVRLGISPFGIWRNRSTDPSGSDTNGLQNYDDLYADVLLWTRSGWVDYMLPQLYWQRDHKNASYDKLVAWWAANANGRHMYIGQDVKRTMDTRDLAPSDNPTQLDSKIQLARSFPTINGNCWWPAYSVTEDYKGVADSLAENRQSTVALVPPYTWIDSIAPDEVDDLQFDNGALTWRAPETTDAMQQAKAFVVYRFGNHDKIDLDESEAIQAVVYTNRYEVPTDVRGKYKYVVTVLDRANNESEKGKSIKVKL